MKYRMRVIKIALFSFLGCYGGQTPGTPNTDFGGKGTGFRSVPIENSYASITSIALDSSGRIVAGGYVSKGGRVILMRFLANGTLDTSFGGFGTGYNLISVGGADTIDTIVIRSNGKIVAAGWGGRPEHALIMQFNSNGTLDENFGTHSGYTLQSIDGGQYEWIRGIELDTNGKIVVCGYINIASPTNAYTAFVMRFHSDGYPDLAFGERAGYTIFSLGPNAEQFHALTIDSQGRILVAGRTTQVPDFGVLVVRFTPDGIVDSTFGNRNGYSVVKISERPAIGYDELRSVVLDCKEQIVASGWGGEGRDALVMRFNREGTLDTTFGESAGYTLINLSNPNYDRIFSIAFDVKHNIIGVGDGAPERSTFIVRFNPNGLIDTTFGGNGTGYRLVDFGGVSSVDHWRELALTDEGNIIVGGLGHRTITIGKFFN